MILTIIKNCFVFCKLQKYLNFYKVVRSIPVKYIQKQYF